MNYAHLHSATRSTRSPDVQRLTLNAQRVSNAPRSTLHASRAFTLIELLVVILVLAILMGITLPLSRFVTKRVKEARQQVMRANIQSALEDYRATYGEYPITPPYANWNSHYPQDFQTMDPNTYSNFPYTKVTFGAGTVESIITHSGNYQVDYGLTYPLMHKQIEEGRRPFMQFSEVTVVYLVYQTLIESTVTIMRRLKSGGLRPSTLLYISGDPVNRAKAIDPASGYQWKYLCTNGLNYTLTTNTF